MITQLLHYEALVQLHMQREYTQLLHYEALVQLHMQSEYTQLLHYEALIQFHMQSEYAVVALRSASTKSTDETLNLTRTSPLHLRL